MTAISTSISKVIANEKHRKRIEKDVQKYLAKGGEIKKIPTGVSAWAEEPAPFYIARTKERFGEL